MANACNSGVGVGLWQFFRLSQVSRGGFELTDPAVNEREQALDAAVGQFGQWDFWPLVARNILTIKAWYP